MTTTDKILSLVLDHASAIQAGNLHKSREAYAAIREALEVREGWRMVPVEPTPEMCRVDFDCDDSIGIDSARICYRAMIEAAPDQPNVRAKPPSAALQEQR
jgi:hypothetical protein